MREYVLLIGLDEPEQHDIIDRIDDFVIAHIALPRIMVRDGQLYAEAPNSPRLLPVKKVVYHGIYDDDMDIITGLALWGGPC
ncbi:MAG: hypothetical protein AAFV33_13565, partial [Chloroflexota bacterium]